MIKKYLEKGLIYIGISAGSYVACPTIEIANWKNQDRNQIGLIDLTALNLVPFLIFAHYQENYLSTLQNAVKTTKLPVVALNNNQAIIVKDDKFQVIGNSERIFFNGFKENY